MQQTQICVTDSTNGGSSTVDNLDSVPTYEPDDDPLTDEQITNIRNMLPQFKDEAFTETLF